MPVHRERQRKKSTCSSSLRTAHCQLLLFPISRPGIFSSLEAGKSAERGGLAVARGVCAPRYHGHLVYTRKEGLFIWHGCGSSPRAYLRLDESFGLFLWEGTCSLTEVKCILTEVNTVGNLNVVGQLLEIHLRFSKKKKKPFFSVSPSLHLATAQSSAASLPCIRGKLLMISPNVLLSCIDNT